MPLNVKICDEERETRAVLEANQISGMPVDVFDIVRSEKRIKLCPVHPTSDQFSGRIEYHHSFQKFLLFYPNHPLAEEMGRVRFSIAHELGHYFLPHHRERLLSGVSHNSEGGFICDREMEREADRFAAFLLMPEKPFARKFRERGYLTLQEIVALADETMVSREAFAIRYAGLSEEACAVIVSSAGRVHYCASSDDARYRRCRLKRGDLLASIPLPSRATPFVEGAIEATTVFPETYHQRKAWIESLSLGYGDRILSLISIESDNDK